MWDDVDNKIKGFCRLSIIDLMDEQLQEPGDGQYGFVEIDAKQKKAQFYPSGNSIPTLRVLAMSRGMLQIIFVAPDDGCSIQSVFLRSAWVTNWGAHSNEQAYVMEFHEFLVSGTTRGLPSDIKTCAIELAGQQELMWYPKPIERELTRVSSLIEDLVSRTDSGEEKTLEIECARSVSVRVGRLVGESSSTALDKTESTWTKESRIEFSFNTPVALGEAGKFVRGFANMASLLARMDCPIQSVHLWTGNERNAQNRSDWKWHFPSADDTPIQPSVLLANGKSEILWNALDKTNEKAVGKFLNEIIHDVSLPINEMVQNLSALPCDLKDTCSILERLGLYGFGKAPKRKGQLRFYLNKIARSTDEYLSLKRVDGKHLVRWTVEVRNSHEHQALKLEQSPQILHDVASSWVAIAVTHMLVRCGFSEPVIRQAMQGYLSPYVALR